jgi:hypothetical protein
MADFGPNQHDVERFLDRLDALDQDDLLRLTAAWEGASGEKRREAWRSARAAARAQKRDAAVDRAQSAVVSWSNRRSPMISDAWGTFVAGDQMRADVARNAVPALVDAIAALVVRDAIPEGAFDELYGPIRSIDEDSEAT